ncbi:MAG TPA: filamentous hemagglutinin N-terminal domain-containing protein, partial [Saliniramus sp.]|nr:filamentous hemagglutinin N-terminal domain-containing protein [Saliniramus sp.]
MKYNSLSQSASILKLSRIATSRFVRSLTVTTAILLAVQPLLVSLAQAQVISDPTAPIQFRPGIGMSPGGAPVVDITAPSFGGLSHNKFESFNVDHNGLILNNSGLGGNSILGGAIAANPNLVGRQPARTILNEVTGSGSSRLGGTTEVFGGRADVIVANPNGVGCFGCSFINAGKITLSSGAPIPDYTRGSVDFDVRGGAVIVSGSGLSGVAGHAPLGDIDLIGRQIAIDAPVVAQDRVRLRAGAMTYQPSGDLVAPLAGAATFTGASIVSTAAGTISAGSISMLSRDLDLGVVLGGDLETGSGSIVITSLGDAILAGTKSAADLRIDAAGHVELLGRHQADGYLAANGDTIIVELADISIADGVVLEALSDIFASGDIVSGTDISLVARGRLVATGRVLAGGRVALEGREIVGIDLDVGGTHISIAATEDLAVEDAVLAAASDVAVSGRDVTLGQGTVFGAPSRLFVGARRDFTNATVLDYANLSLSIGNAFTNTETGAYIRDELAINIPGPLVNAGLIQGRILASIAARSIDNAATGLIDAPELLIAVDEDVENAGLILGREELAIAARSLENAETGVVDADALAIIVDDTLANAGALRGRGGLDILASDLVNLASGLVVGE